MINKPQGYDESWAATGESQALPAGRYVCVVKQVAEQATQNGRPQMVVLFDISEGEQKDFYRKQYEAAKSSSADAKWKGVHKQLMDGSSLPFFKGLMTSIERSNPGYVFPWGVQNNEKTLVGKKFGAVMGREQFQTQDGSLKWATKVVQIRSLDGLKDAEVPEDKPYTGAVNPQGQAGQTGTQVPFIGGMPPQHDTGFMNIPDSIGADELPFN